MFNNLRSWWLKHQTKRKEAQRLRRHLRSLSIDSVGLFLKYGSQKQMLEMDVFEAHQTIQRMEKLELTRVETIRQLNELNNALKMSLEKYRVSSLNGQACVEEVLARGISYYDPEKLPYADQVAYVQKARDALANETLQNEIRHLEADWVEHLAKEAKDFSEVRDMRMCINALELLLSRLAQIPDPRKPMGDEEPFAPI